MKFEKRALIVIPDRFADKKDIEFRNLKPSKSLVTAFAEGDQKQLLREFKNCNFLFTKASRELKRGNYDHAKRLYAMAGYDADFSLLTRWGLSSYADNLACDVYNDNSSKMTSAEIRKISENLPAQSPCKYCGTMLQRPSTAVQGRCPNCNRVQTYAEIHRNYLKANHARVHFRAEIRKRQERYTNLFLADGRWLSEVESLIDQVKNIPKAKRIVNRSRNLKIAGGFLTFIILLFCLWFFTNPNISIDSILQGTPTPQPTVTPYILPTIVRQSEPFVVLSNELPMQSGLAISPDGTLLAAGGETPIIRVWDTNSGRLISELHALNSGIRGLTFNSDGSQLAAANYLDRLIQIWDVGTGQHVFSIEIGMSYIHEVSFTPDGSQLVVIGNPSSVYVYDIQANELAGKFEGHTDSLSCIDFSPDGKFLATGGWDNTVRIWDWETRKQINAYHGLNRISAVEFSPDGNYLAYLDRDGVIEIRNLENQSQYERFDHDSTGTALGFNLDGTILASGGYEDIKLWDWKTGEQISALDHHVRFISDLAFGRDPLILTSVSGSNGKGEAILWNLALIIDSEE